MKLTLALAVAFVVAVPIAVSAHSQEEQEACMNDAFTFCGEAIPDRGRVAACLAAKRSQISSACRSVMARYSVPGSTAQNTSAPGKPLRLHPRVR